MLKKIGIASIVLISMAIMAFTTDFKSNRNTPEGSGNALAGTYDPIVVLELFTSQGCSSCPSADALLEKVKKQYAYDVFALSYHVDYWNYIGWKDPFSAPKYASKQRKYNIKFRNNSNYTPQIVVNGKEHFVGSNSSKMYSKINTYKNKKSLNNITLSNVITDTRSISFEYQVKGALGDKNLRALVVLDERTTQVKRGENRNRTLRNSNVVVSEKSISLKKADGEAYISIPEIVAPNEKIQLIVLVEDIDYDITGASKYSLDR